AYSIYPSPALRPRNDVDFIIREDDAAETRRLLEQLGYEPALNVPGPLVRSPFHYVRTDTHGLLHSCDARFVALPAWGERWRLLREHLFPPRSYLGLRYPRCP